MEEVITSGGSFDVSKEFEVLDGSGVRCCAAARDPNKDNACFLVIGTQMGGLFLVRSNDHNITTTTTSMEVDEDMHDPQTPTHQMEFLFQHDHAVTCVAIWEQEDPNEDSSNSTTSKNNNARTLLRIITGCKDSIIRMFHVDLRMSTNKNETETGTTPRCRLAQTFVGHTKPVTSFDILQQSSFLISGSWDGTAQIWNLKNETTTKVETEEDKTTAITRMHPVAILPDHENSVCVAGIQWKVNDNDNHDSNGILRVATGSAGIAQGNTILQHTLRIWEVPIHHKKGDSAVAAATSTTITPKLIASVANDHGGPIRDLIVRMMITSAAGAADYDGLLATCSNDGTVRVRDIHTGTTQTTLAFVDTSRVESPLLLTLTMTTNLHGTTQYIAAGAEDGQVVVWDYFSSSSSSSAEPQILRHPGSVWDVLALPNDDLVTCCQDGKVRIFTRSSERMASLDVRERFRQYATSVAAAAASAHNAPSSEEIAKLPHWDIRTSMVGKSEGQIQLFQRNQTAIAAQWSDVSRTWIEIGQVTGRNDDTGTIDGVQYDHVFPIEVDVPASDGGGIARLQIGYNNGENPFLAAQRFIDAHMLPQYHLTQIADYVSQRAGAPLPTIGTAPVASASTNPSIVAGAGTPIVQYQFLPISACKKFDLSEKTAVATLQKMKSKILEFLQKQNDPSKNEKMVASIGTLMDTLAAHNRYHASRVQEAELAAISHMLTTFPAAEIFPALDLARLTVLHPDAAAAPRVSYWKDLFQITVTLCRSDSHALEMAIPMLSLRLFANAFVGGPGSRDAAGQLLPDILDCAYRHVQSTNKNIRLSVATVLHNACWYLHQNNSLADNLAPQVVNMINDILTSKMFENEGVFRTIVSLGTLVMSSPVAKEAAKSQYMASKVEPAASPHEQHVKAAAKEVYSVLL
jgi:phospholipase A-2-activating protein